MLIPALLRSEVPPPPPEEKEREGAGGGGDEEGNLGKAELGAVQLGGSGFPKGQPNHVCPTKLPGSETTTSRYVLPTRGTNNNIYNDKKNDNNNVVAGLPWDREGDQTTCVQQSSLVVKIKCSVLTFNLRIPVYLVIYYSG